MSDEQQTQSESAPGLPVGEVLGGLRIPALPDGSEPLGMFALVKLREDDGSTGWAARVTSGWNQEEGLAVLLSYVDNLRREAADDWDEGYTTQAPQ